jgi:hypothetical protein
MKALTISVVMLMKDVTTMTSNCARQRVNRHTTLAVISLSFFCLEERPIEPKKIWAEACGSFHPDSYVKAIRDRNLTAQKKFCVY